MMKQMQVFRLEFRIIIDMINMRHRRIHLKKAIVGLTLSLFLVCKGYTNEPQIDETTFPDRPAVKVEIERMFDLPNDFSGIEDLSMSNPGSEAVLVLASFGSGVTFIATIYEKDDDEVVGDRDVWVIVEDAPPYVQGSEEVVLSETKVTELEQIFASAGIDFEATYIANHNSENEIAAYDKILRARIPKSDPPAGASIVMEILDDIFEFDWQQSTTKKVVVELEE